MKPQSSLVKILRIPFCCFAILMTFSGLDLISPSFNSNQGNTNFILGDQKSFSGYKVVELWDLPDELVEISANILIDNTHMACIQDNKGVIYIYNLKTRAIENSIQFKDKGDFEGLALVGKVYYVLRSDGMLYQLTSTESGKPSVTTYDLPFGPENDTESMIYDKTKHRLLIAVKEKDLASPDKKGIYSFDLATKQMSKIPVLSLDAYRRSSSKGKDKSAIRPSAIAIHPQRGTMLVLNGPSSELLEADFSGTILSTVKLDKNEFPQPEGMCFSASGDFYISSEGGKNQKGIIARVQLF